MSPMISPGPGEYPNVNVHPMGSSPSCKIAAVSSSASLPKENYPGPGEYKVGPRTGGSEWSFAGRPQFQLDNAASERMKELYKREDIWSVKNQTEEEKDAISALAKKDSLDHLVEEQQEQQAAVAKISPKKSYVKEMKDRQSSGSFLRTNVFQGGYNRPAKRSTEMYAPGKYSSLVYPAATQYRRPHTEFTEYMAAEARLGIKVFQSSPKGS